MIRRAVMLVLLAMMLALFHGRRIQDETIIVERGKDGQQRGGRGLDADRTAVRGVPTGGDTTADHRV